METIGYIRVSSQEQVDSGLSLQAQRRKIEAFCAYQNMTLLEIIEDANVSASIPLRQREGGANLFKKANTSITAVRLDRLFRDAHDCLGVTKIWNEKGVSLNLLDLGIDTSTAMGRAFLTNAATFAELERNLISERTKEALHQVKLNGGTLGRERFGWGRTEEVDSDGRRKVVPISAEIETVALCKALREQGITLQQIANRFNAENRPTKRGGKWHPSTIRNYCSS